VIDVEPKLAAVIAQLLIDRSVNFSLREIEVTDRGKVSTPAPDSRQFVSQKAQAAMAAILNNMTPETSYYYKDFCPLIEREGLGATSVSPLMSQLARSGKVRKGKRGYWIKEETNNA
jgi:hypothetical protein